MVVLVIAKNVLKNIYVKLFFSRTSAPWFRINGIGNNIITDSVYSESLTCEGAKIIA